MSLTIQTTRSTHLPLKIAQQIRNNLTNANSVTQQDMDAVIRGMLGQYPADHMPDFSLAVACVSNPYTDENECIGWASATVWDRINCLQAFVDPAYRNKGLATALASALLVDNMLGQDMPLGVFSPECDRIAQRLAFRDIKRYRRTDEGWLPTESYAQRKPERVESQ